MQGEVTPFNKEALSGLYDWVGNFCEGLARAQLDGKWLHIHENGNPAYEERYDEVGEFCKQCAKVRCCNQFFYIRSDGTRI